MGESLGWAQQGDGELSSFPSLPGEGRGQLGQGVHGVIVLSPYTGWLAPFNSLFSQLSPGFSFKGFPGGSDGKESAFNVGDAGSIPGLGRSLGEGNGSPLQYSGLENHVDGGARRLQSMCCSLFQARPFTCSLLGPGVRNAVGSAHIFLRDPVAKDSGIFVSWLLEAAVMRIQ